MTRLRWTRRLALAATLLAAAAAPAFAHAHLRGSSPSANARLARVPAELRLTFSEAAELAFTTVRLVGRGGRAVPLGPVRFADATHRSIVVDVGDSTASGTLEVQWQIAGADGHPVRGRFTFVVERAVPPPAPLTGATAAPPASDAGHARESATARAAHHDTLSMPGRPGAFGAESAAFVAVRWLGYVALLLVIGAASFRELVLARIAADRDDDDEPRRAMTRRTARLGLAASLALGVALAARLVAQSVAMHPDDGALGLAPMWAMLHTTTWGWSWALQAAALLLSASGFGLALRELDDRGGAGWPLAGAGALVGAFAPALAGHAAAMPRLRALAMAADGLHVLAASCWLGTLAALLLVGLRGTRGAIVRTLVERFSRVALASAAVVVLTGAFAAWLHVGTIAALWQSRYGVVLLVKLAVLTGVAATGWYNWRRVGPTLGTDAATAGLERSARVEVGVAVMVLLVTAVLVATPPSVDLL